MGQAIRDGDGEWEGVGGDGLSALVQLLGFRHHWRLGMCNRLGTYMFLEVLRHRLPESLEHILAFINITYKMLALLYKTVPTFEATWIECLGNLTRDLLYL